MSRIIGVTVGTTSPRPDWKQTNEKRADFIKNKPETVDRTEFEAALGAYITDVDALIGGDS